MYEELKIYQDIDIKFNRISKPLFNSIDLPLSGLYQDINNIEDQNYNLKNQFKNFVINNNIGADNLFQLKNNFDKLLTEETLEGIIILTNISNKDIIIKNLEITLIYEKNEKMAKNMKITLPNKDNTLYLSSNKSYSIKIKNSFKKEGKYSFSIKFIKKSNYYDQQYYLIKQRVKIRDSNKRVKRNNFYNTISNVYYVTTYNNRHELNKYKEEVKLLGVVPIIFKNRVSFEQQDTIGTIYSKEELGINE